MDCKPATLKTQRGLCEEKGREVQKKTDRARREGMRDAAVYKCVVGIVSLSH